MFFFFDTTVMSCCAILPKYQEKPMNVLLLSSGYPADMPEFTPGLAEVGARAFGECAKALR